MLRSRSFLIFVGVVLFIMGSPFLVARYTLMRALEGLEHRSVHSAMQAIQRTIDAELLKLRRTAENWAFWDDTYRFVDDLNEAYIDGNLNKETFINLHVRAMLFYDTKRHLRYQAAYDLETGEPDPLPGDFLDRISSTPSIFLADDDPECLSGMLVHGDRVMFSAACPILTSKYEGPRQGTLVVLRELGEEMTKFLQQAASHPVRFEMVPLQRGSASVFEPTVVFFPDRVLGRFLVPDLSERVGLVVETTLERSIRREGVRSFLVFSSALALLAVFAMGLLWFFMDRRVLGRISDLLLKVRRLPISSEGMPEERGSDEIVALDRSIDGLVHALQRSIDDNHRYLQETQKILENHPTGMILIDAEKRTVSWVNKKALELIGRSLDEVRHVPCKDVVCPSQERECPVLDHGREVCDVECVMPTRDGRGVPVLRSITLVTFKQRPHLLEVVTDLRQQKALEAQLDRAKKLETVGLVAGGVAHDLNNLLTSLVGYPDMLLRRLPPDHALYQPLNRIRDAGLKASAIVQDLLTLARRGVKSMEDIDVGDVVREFLSSAEYAALCRTHVRVRFKTKVEGRRLCCRGSRPHLEKALANLVRNAAEAIADTGTVTVGLQVVQLNEPYTGFETIPPGRWICLSVEDTGSGISQEDLPHIFEPFYTKKKMGGSGTGLGMTIVWHAVKDMGGFVDVVSMPGEGTSVRLYLPEAEPPAETARSPMPAVLPRGSGEKVLVVEDMDDQRDLVKTLLTDLGYEVTCASSGVQAIRLAADQQFDLLVLDMRLEDDLDGLQVYQEFLKRRADQKAIIVSGDVSKDRLAAAEALGISHFMAKPYTMEKLAKIVYAALQEEAQ
ncbi:CHASE4 domain-containing protein [Desulfosoma caldarium]|uniref:histidine kinase n=1 Tax=Desulfosoma caldarium TaxID=610254 RepID=A0A3N1ULH2_9BACT|nr:CHASE4 domain-containing protein [Desulfosoma caldarium]ROQ92075.1 PAS domain S-box-containing protein [Desulfosoma caldarium]